MASASWRATAGAALPSSNSTEASTESPETQMPSTRSRCQTEAPSGRVATSIATRSPSKRRATNASANAEEASSQCASSIITRTALSWDSSSKRSSNAAPSVSGSTTETPALRSVRHPRTPDSTRRCSARSALHRARGGVTAVRRPPSMRARPCRGSAATRRTRKSVAAAVAHPSSAVFPMPASPSRQTNRPDPRHASAINSLDRRALTTATHQRRNRPKHRSRHLSRGRVVAHVHAAPSGTPRTVPSRGRLR